MPVILLYRDLDVGKDGEGDLHVVHVHAAGIHTRQVGSYHIDVGMDLLLEINLDRHGHSGARDDGRQDLAELVVGDGLEVGGPTQPYVIFQMV